MRSLDQVRMRDRADRTLGPVLREHLEPKHLLTGSDIHHGLRHRRIVSYRERPILFSGSGVGRCPVAKQHEEERGLIIPIFNPSEAHSSGGVGQSWQDDEDWKSKAGGALRRLNFSGISRRGPRSARIMINQPVFGDIVWIMSSRTLNVWQRPSCREEGDGPGHHLLPPNRAVQCSVGISQF
jgi:hypothetical protein